MPQQYSFDRLSFCWFAVFMFSFTLISNSVFGRNAGITAQSTAGCTCHGGNADNATSLSLTGGGTVNTGSTTALTFTVSHANKTAAGFNLGIVDANGTTAGTISAIGGQGTRIENNEITHDTRKAFTGGSASFQFNWQAPNTPGIYTIRAAGNAVDQSGNENGDVWNLMTQSITVRGINLTSATGGQSWCASTTQTINWTSYGVTNVRIELSNNSGSTYTQIGTSTSVDGTTNSWNWTIPGSQATASTYRIRVIDVANGTIFGAGTSDLTISSGVNITAEPQAPTTPPCVNGNLTLSVTATGGGLTYQWRKNGNNLTGKTAQTMTITNVVSGDAGTYTVVVTGTCGTPATSQGAVVTITPLTVITIFPIAQNLCQGSAATFSVTATGANLTYQWKKNGVDIPGATASTYSIPTTTPADEAPYTVAVTGTCSSQTSAPVTLTLSKTPVLLTSPQDQTHCRNSVATVSAVFTTTGETTYLWHKNSTPLANDARVTGVLTQQLTINGFSSVDEGNYFCKATSVLCTTSTQSVPARVSLFVSPSISAQPSGMTVPLGGNINLSVSALGNDLKYQWKRNGTIIPDGTASTVTINSAVKTDEGDYTVSVSNACSTVVSNIAKVTVSDVPTPVLSLNVQEINFGKLAGAFGLKKTFTITNSGTANLIVGTLSNLKTEFVLSSKEGFTLLPNESKSFDVTFTGTKGGDINDVVILKSNGGDNDLILKATVLERITNPITIDFGFNETEVGQKRDSTISICNKSTEDISVNTLTVSGVDAGSFTTTAALPLTIIAGKCVDVALSFAPSREGVSSATLSVITNQSTETIALTARGKKSTEVSWEESIGLVSLNPNPVNTSATLKFERPITANISVLNSLGQVVNSTSVSSTEQLTITATDFSGNSLATGLYHIVVVDKSHRLTLPFALVR